MISQEVHTDFKAFQTASSNELSHESNSSLADQFPNFRTHATAASIMVIIHYQY